MQRRTTLAALGSFALAPGAWAQPAYPSAPVKLIVPYAAGGGLDAVTRLLAQGLGERLGQTFVVENRAGAGGMLGADVVAKAVPDGYTLLMAGNPELTITPALTGTAPYVPSRLSFMISRILSLVQPPPNPSQVSANPSSWKAPVRQIPAIIESSTATGCGQIRTDST